MGSSRAQPFLRAVGKTIQRWVGRQNLPEIWGCYVYDDSGIQSPGWQCKGTYSGLCFHSELLGKARRRVCSKVGTNGRRLCWPFESSISAWNRLEGSGETVEQQSWAWRAGSPEQVWVVSWDPLVFERSCCPPTGWRHYSLNFWATSSPLDGSPLLSCPHPLHVGSAYGILTWRKVSFFSSTSCLFLWRNSSSALREQNRPQTLYIGLKAQVWALLERAGSEEEQTFL